MTTLTKELAQILVAESLAARPAGPGPEQRLVVVEEATIEAPWGWAFFYAPHNWRETGDIRQAIAANGPVIVERTSGRLIPTESPAELDPYSQLCACLYRPPAKRSG